MLVKILIAMIIMISVLTLGNGNSLSYKDSLTDKMIGQNAEILDNALINYYITHSGQLPEELTADFYKVMGLEGLQYVNNDNPDGKTYIIYSKLADSKFKITVKYINSVEAVTSHSEKELPAMVGPGSKEWENTMNGN